MSDENPFASPGGLPSGAAEDGEYIDAGSGRRFLAYLFDTVLWVGVVFTLWMAVAMVFAIQDPQGFDIWLEQYDGVIDLVSRVLSFAIPIAYGAVFESSPLQATPGKLLLGLKVLNKHGEAPDFAECLTRNTYKTFVVNCCCGIFALTAWGDKPGFWNEQTGDRVVRKILL